MGKKYYRLIKVNTGTEFYYSLRRQIQWRIYYNAIVILSGIVFASVGLATGLTQGVNKFSIGFPVASLSAFAMLLFDKNNKLWHEEKRFNNLNDAQNYYEVMIQPKEVIVAEKVV